MEEFSGAFHKWASTVYNFLLGLGALDLVSWEAAMALCSPHPALHAVLAVCELILGGKAHC